MRHTMIPDIVVPGLSFEKPTGGLDIALIGKYARRLATTMIPHFIVNGSTTGGDRLAEDDRAAVLDTWLESVGQTRLIACCWTAHDMNVAFARGIVPMAVLRGLRTKQELSSFVGDLPRGAFLYSHPMFGGLSFEAAVAAEARRSSMLPAGAKLAKIDPSRISEMREATGPEFRLWDGSSRNISRSCAAGASGVVATPLCIIPKEVSDWTVPAIQSAVDEIQLTLDALPTRDDKAQYLRACAVHEIGR